MKEIIEVRRIACSDLYDILDKLKDYMLVYKIKEI